MSIDSHPAQAVPERAHTMALAELMAGNLRFVTGQPRHGHDVSAAAAASGGQQPHSVVLGCMDSRVPVEAIFDQTFGSICAIRSGAHVLDQAVLGSVEFGVSVLGAPLVLVLGHERCGAVTATVEAVADARRADGSMGYLVDQIAPAVTEVTAQAQAAGTVLERAELTAAAVRRHVRCTVRELSQHGPLVAAIAAGEVAVVGAVYDLDTGRVTQLT